MAVETYYRQTEAKFQAFTKRLLASAELGMYFPLMPEHHGVLTKPGDNINAMRLGIMLTSSESVIRRDVKKGRPLTLEEQDVVIKRGFHSGIGGHFEVENNSPSFSTVTLDVEHQQAEKYFQENSSTMSAFLRNFDSHIVYPKSERVIRLKDGKLKIIFPGDIPPDEPMDLLIINSPLKGRTHNDNFDRVRIMLVPDLGRIDLPQQILLEPVFKGMAPKVV